MHKPTAQEQLMLELVNRARMNPTEEAAEYEIDLNQGLSPGEILPSAKQPLAFNFKLIDAARDHSQWMLNTNTFSHTGAGGSSARDRMESAGYNFTGGWAWGENIAWQGTTGTPDVTQFVIDEHESLFLSPGHRTNILSDNFRELGIGVKIDPFTTSSGTYNAVMTTQKFAKSGSSVFLTGVAFDDAVIDDDFYSVGEGLAGIDVIATRQSDGQSATTTTFESGGYQMALEPGTYDVTFSGGELEQTVTKTVSIGNKNIKLDLATDQLPSESASAPNEGPDETIGEYGQLTLNQKWETVTLQETYENPVVIVSDPTRNGAAPVVARLRNIATNEFQIRLQEPNYEDGRHTRESLSYMVMEAGDWQLADGTRLSAGIHQGEILSSQGFNSIDLTGFQATPTVLSQVQTFNDSDWVSTRMTQQSPNSFQLAMQEEESLNRGTHAQEDIGWLAIDQGAAFDGDTLLEGKTTERQYTHRKGNVALEAAFESSPSVIAKLGSFYGRDIANLRLEDISREGFGVRVQEEKSLDNELRHTKESVSFLALAGESGLLSGVSV